MLQEGLGKDDALGFAQFAGYSVHRSTAREARATALGRDVKSRIDQDGIRLLSFEQKSVAGRVIRMATQKAVRSQGPTDRAALDSAGPCRLFAGSWSSGSGALLFFSAASSRHEVDSLPSENPVNSMSSN